MQLATVLCLLTGWHSVQTSAPGQDASLPEAWHGVWSGQLTVHTVWGKSFERFMQIEVAPVPSSKSVTWRITSTFGDKKSVRNYQLVPDAKKAGLFQMDEKNGILIDARLMGNTLYTYFKDGDMLTHVRYENRGTGLYMEMASVSLKDPRISAIKSEGIEIQSYELKTVQVGELKKKTGK